jgi:hypothetical protein
MAACRAFVTSFTRFGRSSRLNNQAQNNQPSLVAASGTNGLPLALPGDVLVHTLSVPLE